MILKCPYHGHACKLVTVIFSKTNEILSMKYLWPSTITIQNICLYSIFCDSLTNFHKVFFSKIVIGDHYI